MNPAAYSMNPAEHPHSCQDKEAQPGRLRLPFHRKIERRASASETPVPGES